MASEELSRARRVAEAAPPGPWKEVAWRYWVPSALKHREAYAAHIALFDPPTVLAFVAVAEAAELAEDRGHEALARFSAGGRCSWCGAELGEPHDEEMPCPISTMRSLAAALAALQSALSEGEGAS